MITVLVRRHLRCFFRDKMAVLFSILGAIILLGLYVLFLGKLQIDSLSVDLPESARNEVEGFVFNWAFSGILVTSAITVPQAALGVLVEDRTRGGIKDFLVAPISRTTLTISYILAAVIVAMTILLIEFIVGSIGIAALGHLSVTLLGVLKLVIVLFVICLTFAAIAAFLITLVKSQGGMSALSSLVGTLAGFLAGAYIPPIALPTTVVHVLNFLPFSPAAMLIRQVIAAPALENTLFPPEVLNELQYGYGIKLEILGQAMTVWLAVGIVAAWGVLFGLIAAFKMKSVVR
ncbi:ABC transporter permease [Corynebacterium suranareeae]|uniref:ABC transporter permease n=1 Tax=Corynebacterium suranareeae TaxID=2506452 RepID=A0A160PQU0_9CORY|nr:ABC transporter permease [Corynebacterium suranareeae]BAU96389.1 ABC transporter permease [Corynebacterium suranareeae]